MAQRGFWHGFSTAIFAFAVLTLCSYIEHYVCSRNFAVCSPAYSYAYPGGMLLAILLLLLLHYYLTKARNRLQQKHQLQRVKDIADTLYPNNGKLSIRFLEIRRHVGVHMVKVSWVAGIASRATVEGDAMLFKTEGTALTKEKALDEMHRALARRLMQTAAELPAAAAALAD